MKIWTPCALAMTLAVVFGPGSALAAGGAAGEEPHRRFMPGTTITLKPRKQFYFLGENILLDYKVSYDGDGFLAVGTDHGFGIKDFTLVAIDTAGKQLPASTRVFDGGGSGGRSLRRGGSVTLTASLSFHCRLEGPGIYRIRAAHDLGWSKRDPEAGRTPPVPKDDPRWTETFIEVRTPEPAEARKVVEHMRRLKRDISDYRACGFWDAEDFADFACLRYSVYLPILEELVTDPKGDPRALLGITHNPAPEATAALFRLLKGADTNRTRKITAALCKRLPDPPGVIRPDRRIPFQLEHADLRDFFKQEEADLKLVKGLLSDKFAGPMRQFARRMLAGDDMLAVQCAAYILEAIGTRDDLPDLVAAVNRLVPVVERTNWPEYGGEFGEIVPTRDACIDVTHAIAALAARGAEPTADPRTPGEVIHFVLSAKHRANFRPEGWEKRCVNWIRNGTPFVRDFALLNAPRPLPSSLAEPYREGVRRVIATAREGPVIHGAVRYALELKIPVDEILGILVERLDTDVPRLYEEIANCLADLLATGKHDADNCIGCMITPEKNERPAIKTGWKCFLQVQRQAILEGNRFELEDPGVPRLKYP